MHSRARFLYARVEPLHASALDIPYEGDRFTMVVLLPDNVTGLAAVRNGLSLATLEDVGSRLSFRDVILQLPKFDRNLSYNLVPVIRAIGLNSVFGGSADFSGISDAVPLALSDVCHRAAVEVNEEGTIATAVAGLDIVAVSAQLNRSPPIEFTVDHPLVFYVRDRSTNRVLVIGEVNAL
ncbi:hypothetical protein HPB51_001212 [Rhipicephalus microplus]|uniref:Serpin domain-containing protein n=1 Tax=Rhipicephalus microplus TaxID=6941 RepID=A0A9J6DS43_RHIMP|nr:hypothetical protein HPB51_001212 [Rhipicephalus microplus]